MGTNFYAFSTDKKFMHEHFSRFELTDDPAFGYIAHLAKTSCGWKPLFEMHKAVKSVKEIMAVLKSDCVKIYDEYDNEYSLDEFKHRVIDWNKGDPEVQGHDGDEHDSEGYDFYDGDFC